VISSSLRVIKTIPLCVLRFVCLFASFHLICHEMMMWDACQGGDLDMIQRYFNQFNQVKVIDKVGELLL
jgi:hypothetical protein